MTQEITVTHDQSVSMINRNVSLPNEHEMMVFTTISKQAVESKLYKNVGDQAGIMMVMLAARELGIPPMLALSGGIRNIQGNLEISARMMNALMRRAGISITIKESTDSRCVLTGKRTDGDIATVSYTIEEAQKAGLIKAGGNWTKIPKDMCFARAISRLARQIAPDVIGGCYVEGEIKATENEIDVPSDVPVEMDIPVINYKEMLERLMNLFNEEDRYLVLEYLEIVKKHFGWTSEKVVDEFLKDSKAVVDKFNNWKSKRKL